MLAIIITSFSCCSIYFTLLPLLRSGLSLLPIFLHNEGKAQLLEVALQFTVRVLPFFLGILCFRPPFALASPRIIESRILLALAAPLASSPTANNAVRTHNVLRNLSNYIYSLFHLHIQMDIFL